MLFRQNQFFQRLFAFFAVLGTFLIGFPVGHRAQIRPMAVVYLQNEQTSESAPKLAFEENRGQFDRRVRYLARAGRANLFLTADEAVYVLPLDKKANTETQTVKSNRAFALRMKIVGANPESSFAGDDEGEQKTNYFKGAEENWRTNIPNFGRVRYENVYEGVSMIWHGLENGAARYDFVVAPNADANRIALEFDGADNLEIDVEGNLLIHTPVGEIKQNKPFTFQETDGFRQEIESRFVIENSKVKFALGEYDRSKPLTIDPTVNLNNLSFSTFLGGFNDDQAFDLKVDPTGGVYVTGYTESPFFPTTAGTFDTTFNANPDVFVTRLNPAGTQIVFSTFVGGNNAEEGRALSIDSTGNIYVAGQTLSAGFPTTAGAFDTTHNSSVDVFAFKLNPTGSALIYSTFLGGGGIDEAYGLARDANNNVYVIGRTNGGSPAFPTTASGFDTTFGGVNDIFLSKLDANGASLLYSTFLGGTTNEFGFDIALDTSGNAYVTGFSSGNDYPTTVGAFDTTFNGTNDVVVSKINTTLTGAASLVYSTYIGGTDSDSSRGIAVDSLGNVYLACDVLNDTGFPTTAGAFDTTHNGAVDIAVVKLNATATTLVYSTFIGGTSTENGNGIAVDASGNVYLTGVTNDTTIDFPTTGGAFDTVHNGGQDAFVTKFNATGSALLYSTFLGGAGNDVGQSVAADVNGNIYVAGFSTDAVTNLPTTSEAVQPQNGGLEDAFVSKLGDFSISGRVIDATTGAPLPSVMIALSGQTSDFMLTGTDGRFGFTNTVNGQPFAVSASRAGYQINPAVFNITSLNNNRDLVFVGSVGSPTGGSGGTLRFELNSYLKSENGASVTLTVKRVGEIQTTDPVTVDFTTSDETATAGTDYQTTIGTLTFNAAETAKTITVPLSNDTTLEPKETFSITLSNPTNNADIDPQRGTATVQILDEDLANGDLLISEFRQRGRLGAHDEFVKLFNPNDFDITINAPDNSSGLTLARENNGVVTLIRTIPNLVTIGARGHYLLTNNNPSGGFSLLGYPTGTGGMVLNGDDVFSADIPDNSTLILLKTSDAQNFTEANLLDAVGFGASQWSEGKSLPTTAAENAEMSYVRKIYGDNLQDSGNNAADFLLVDNQARIFAGNETKVYAALGAPAPAHSESLRLASAEQIKIEETGAGIFDSTSVPNGTQGTLTVYRKITNLSDQTVSALRLRAVDFPTIGAVTQKRFSSRPDFRLLSSFDEGAEIKGVTLVAENLQPNGGGLNSALAVSAVTSATPLLPGQSITVAIRFGVMRYGRHPLVLAAETD